MKQINSIFRNSISIMTILFLSPTLNAQCSNPSPATKVQLNRCDVKQWLGGDGVPVPLTNSVHFSVAGYWRVVTSNGIPDHSIGVFGVDPVIACGRPTQIKQQNYTFVMPAYSAQGKLWPPGVKPLPTPPFEGAPAVTFGVAVNGVPFDPAANEWLDIVNNVKVETKTDWTINPLRCKLMKYDLDSNNGHVQSDGAYHYHGYPKGLYNQIKDEQKNKVVITVNGSVADNATRKRYKIVLLGWAFDGNPIYGEQCGKDTSAMINAKSSYKIRTPFSTPAVRTSTSTPSTASHPLGDFLEDYLYDEALFNGNPGVQLDECNGHTGITPEFPHGVYHYHILEETQTFSDMGFPYIGRCYRLFTYGEGPNIFPKPPK